MAEEKSAQEKTEKPSQRRRDEARKKGQVAKSQEVTSVSILFASLGLFYFASIFMVEKLSQLMRWGFAESGRYTPLTAESLTSLFVALAVKVALCLFPLLLTVVVTAITTNLMQVGFMLSFESIAPKLSKINPINGLQRLFSMKSLVELVKSILKICIVGAIAYLTIKGETGGLIILGDQSVGDILSYTGSVAHKIIFRTCLALILLAILDYAFQRWEYEKNLRMSKQEVKDEMKHTEGDPFVKAQIRRIQRETARRRMIANVAKADVVITNPTHIAVALAYERATMVAPRVIAKGKGFIAEKIKEIARENKVPVVENKILAQLLNKTVDVNENVPEELYRAVAEVLAYVYKLGGRRSSEWGNG